jgi:hypothetical protein
MWKGLVYVDRAVMFGLASSAGVFGAIADMLVAILQEIRLPELTKVGGQLLCSTTSTQNMDGG